MVQGAVKKSNTRSSASKRPTTHGPKKGARTIAPRKASLIKQQKITKKHSAGLTAQTERNLAQKAGHLEMLVKEHKKRTSTEKKAGNNGKAK